MYSAIYFSYKKINNPKLTEAQINFDGFDGNNEIKHMNYCKFIINSLGRFAELGENGRKDYNSHSQRCQKYKNMITAWKSMTNPYDLNEDQISIIINTH